MIEQSEDIRRDAQIGFRVNKRLKEDLERLARADRRSLASYLEILLEAHVESKKQHQAGKKR